MLQSIFEFQSMICELTGMDVANASMYDGATSLAESAIMAVRITKRKHILVSEALHPEYRKVLWTYARAFGIRIIEIPTPSGLSDMDDLTAGMDPETACVMVQYPNFFGCIEDLKAISDEVHNNGSLFITSVVEPVALGLLRPPGEFGADMVVGEAQGLGNSMNMGGPHLGIMAVKSEYLKRLPGRLSGLTIDTENRKGFILTLQTREQHIRRDRATSNICTNQALNALATTIYLALAGKKGLREVAEHCARNAHYTLQRLEQIPGLEERFSAPFFNEFTLRCQIPPSEINNTLLRNNIIGGLELERFYPELSDSMLLCTTEMNTREEIDTLVEAMQEVMS
jgi:glycine dehydrogenase subunit 1